MNGLSIIIPSKNHSNLYACAGAIRQAGETCRIIVVDDSDWDPLPNWNAGFMAPCLGVKGEKEFIFSRNVNIGIRAAGTDDVVILNDDAKLETRGGFSLLQKAAAEHPEFGIIAATTNNVGNRNQFPRGIGLREDLAMVCFVAVFIPRAALDRVGLLDERYDCYSHQDGDWCRSARAAGLKIGIHDGCFVDHASLPSSFRGPGGPGGEIKTGARIYFEKWGEVPA